jgi:tetratricopeptide (TPR) repeat protein
LIGAAVENRRYGFILAALVGIVAFAATSARAEPAGDGPKPLFCLSTEFFPLLPEQVGDGAMQNRLCREIARQAVLVAAREELQLPTRDETLQEPFPEATATQPPPLSLELRIKRSGPYTIRLLGDGEKLIWETKGELANSAKTRCFELTEQLTKQLPDMAVKLRDAGFAGEPAKLDESRAPTPEMKRLLREMSFVSQFGAVRLAHQAIAEKGPSLALYGVLVRGYANLSLLTEHYMSSQPEAFAARSLLYAERMMQLSGGSTLARWHRAYALAIVGIQGVALDELEALEKLASDASNGDAKAANSSKKADDQPPSWAKLVGPYCRFEREEVARIGLEEKSLSELAALLRWQIYRCYYHGRWTYDKGNEIVAACPEIFGVYHIQSSVSALVTSRTGAYGGPVALATYVPRRVGRLSGLPKVVAELAIVEQPGVMSRLFGQQPTERAFSERPANIAAALADATQTDPTDGNLSWSVLAGLINDEELVEIANFLHVSLNAVESSLAEYMSQFEPLIKNHRYAPFIRSYSYKYAQQPEEYMASLADLKIVDPRGNMRWMFRQAWASNVAAGDLTGRVLSWRSVPQFDETLSGVLESAYVVGHDWWSQLKPENRRMLADALLEVSPKSPNAFRMQIELADDADKGQLAKWEAEAPDDPITWMDLGQRYYRLKEFDAAARCYKRSIDLSPSYDATVGLATAYKEGGKPELWQPTLEAYLKVEDLGLTHAQIHQLIANELIAKRDFQGAKPHAVAAGQTWSAWGLQLASEVCEGLQEWEQSEQWIAEATRNYPTYRSGMDWYFWCCRTGRGDLEAARSYAAKCVEMVPAQQSAYAEHYAGAFWILEGDLQKALDVFTGIEDRHLRESDWDRAYRLMHEIALTAELHDEERMKQLVGEMRELIKTQTHEGAKNWYDPIEMVCQAFAEPDKDKQNGEFLAMFDKALDNTEPMNRANYDYFMGLALDLHGRTDEGELYWRRAAFGGPFDTYNATLAGHRLASRHGPDRGGMPPELAAQEAAAKAARKKEGGRKSDEDDAAGKEQTPNSQ